MSWGLASLGYPHSNMCFKSISGGEGICVKSKVTKGSRFASLFEEIKIIPF